MSDILDELVETAAKYGVTVIMQKVLKEPNLQLMEEEEGLCKKLYVLKRQIREMACYRPYNKEEK